jgi:drug/metabolite transporter (DMT)-like permease
MNFTRRYGAVETLRLRTAARSATIWNRTRAGPALPWFTQGSKSLLTLRSNHTTTMRHANSLYLIILITANTVLSHSLLKAAMSSISFPSGWSGAREFILQCASSSLVWTSLTLQVVGYVCWMAVISRERLAVAVAVSGAMFYLVMGMVGWLVFDERLNNYQLVGLTLVSSGVFFMVLS